MSINGAAAATGLSRNYIRTGCISGEIPYIKCGTKYMVNVVRLLELLNAGGTESE